MIRSLHTAQDVVNQSVNSVVNSAQQVGQSLQEATTQTIDYAKGYLDQNLQAADQFKATTSTAIQTVISASIHDWLVQHPIFLRLVQILDWGTNHPIISVIILLFGLTLIWSIIKAIMRLIETASWSILQVPLKLIQALIKVSFLSFIKVSSFAIRKITHNEIIDTKVALLSTNYLNESKIAQDKQQRLAEISRRLEAIQQEQKELLQEAADLIADETIDIKIPEVKLTSSQT
ncbi:hypothetical protein Nos7524_4422 [Nostoc sp. PCC 7524]|uniref:hypothetical protein n=1 Tax=Nostoc sp. (strain ATCC 29411 / PCC 7524) TaxID=28072 RepID=UPI00029F3F66|nr:hypothetical protein [Nostoc sp. PCC 7524]AFY50181.1 hypothetical protein Nos7524_4422 [Nostoc sp. PCC 7524]